MDPYTAYEDKGVSPFSIATDIAAAPFKPSTYLWSYTHMPSLWSGTKGISLPWDSNQIKAASRSALRLAKQGKIVGAAGQLAKMPMALRPWGGGTRAMPSSGLEKTKNLLKFYKKRLERVVPRIQARRDKITNIITNYKTRRAEMRGSEAILSLQHKVTSKFNSHRSQARRWIPRHKEAIASLRAKGTKYSTKIGQLQGKIALGRLAKWGLRAGKVAATAGAVMFAWDIAKMVGEPIGRAAVAELDTALSTWNDRFMPELGGQLEMSYLSRGAATDRQRALNAMSKAQITGRSAFGQEAKYAHQ